MEGLRAGSVVGIAVLAALVVPRFPHARGPARGWRGSGLTVGADLNGRG
ncbi:MAG TPA: hypothetical protein VJ224_02140 [Thermoplasmata archaeon]|nr:hypothetical protein [Thermoplasmata archaeon]